MRTTKHASRLLSAAHELGRRSLRMHWHRCAPKKFTVPQLFACLVLKEFLRVDYRKLTALLEESPTWCEAIGLSSVPHFTTFQKTAVRLMESRRVQRMLDHSVAMAQELSLLPKRCRLAAIDGTGLESTTASRYFVRRAQKQGKNRTYLTYRDFPKIGVVTDCRSHLILAIVHERGPSPDVKHFAKALDQTLRRLPVDTLLADAGYDSEASHRHAREVRGVRSLIPARVTSPKGSPPVAYYRRLMHDRIHNTRYNQRSQVETTTSMYKRLLGSALRARKHSHQRREAALKAITLNLMIL